VELSNDLVSKFVKATKDSDEKNTESTVYGTTVLYNDRMYVKLDGSDLLTPITKTTNVKENERVTVMIKDHTATVTGNITSPSARTGDVEDMGDAILLQVDEIYADKAIVGELEAEIAHIDTLIADKASIEQLEAEIAYIDTLIADKASIEQLEAEVAMIDSVYAKKAEIESLDTKYATIDFSNIGEAAVEKLVAESGMIENMTVSEGTITGTLVGVTIKGDLIEGGTIVADKLVVKGEDGLYYKLNTDGVSVEAEQTDYNSINGSIITAQSITATKIAVDDLVAFGATIGGFNITSNSLYSDVKASVDNSTRGIYLDTEGQFSVGDSNNFLRYFKTVDEDGNEIFKLEISAESILFGANAKSSASDLKALTEHVKIGTWVEMRACEVIYDVETDTYATGKVIAVNLNSRDITITKVDGAYTSEGYEVCLGDDFGYDYVCFIEDVTPSVELAEGDSDFKQVITNEKTMFMDGSEIKTEINTDGVESENVTVRRELRHGNWVRVLRSNGNYGLIWKEDD
jgi:hypothetical protein